MPRLLRVYEKKRGDRRTGSSKLGSVGEALFFGVFFAMGFGGLVIMLLAIVWPEWRANRHFVQTECTVLGKSISEKRDDDGPTYRPDIRIEYQAAGVRQESVTYDATLMYSNGREKAEAALARFEVGKKYPVWYDPLQPDRAVLVRGYSGWFYLFLLVPISFLVIGGGGLALTLLHWGTSAERRSSLSQRANNIDLLNDPMNDRITFPNVPAAGDLNNSPGTKLAYRLPIATAPGWALFAAFFACVFWNGITSIFVVIAARSHMKGQPEWFLTIFIIPFVVIGLILVYALIRQFLITTGVGPTRVEIATHPLHPGEKCDLLISQAGRLTMNSLEVQLVCEEHATYRQGTDTRTDQQRVFEQQIFRREGFAIDQADPFEQDCTLTIPPTAMHSFKSHHNEVRWKLIIKGDVSGWPDFDREYPIIVYPAGHRESKA